MLGLRGGNRSSSRTATCHVAVQLPRICAPLHPLPTRSRPSRSLQHSEYITYPQASHTHIPKHPPRRTDSHPFNRFTRRQPSRQDVDERDAQARAPLRGRARENHADGAVHPGRGPRAAAGVWMLPPDGRLQLHERLQLVWEALSMMALLTGGVPLLASSGPGPAGHHQGEAGHGRGERRRRHRRRLLRRQR